jgi:uncharacterized protein (DUF2252 family)
MNALSVPLVQGQDSRTRAERQAVGKALRGKVPRSSHRSWSPAPDRPDPVDLLEESNRTRLPKLVPIRYGRMLLSPFAFLRGSAVIMAQDLAATPVTGLQVQVSGDAHLSNFGIYTTPERRQVFDVNDFDETLPGPWEWDVKRLAASIIVAGRGNGFSTHSNREAVLSGIQSYREHMWAFAEMRQLHVWYSYLEVEKTLSRFRPINRQYFDEAVEKARRQTSVRVFPQLTQHVHGQYRIKDDPPLIMHLKDDELAGRLWGLVEGYGALLPDDRRVLLSRYHLVDLAEKVVGVGSVGTRCYVALLLGMGNDSSDPLFLQIKEAQTSVLEPHLGPSIYPNHAQRVVNGQHLMQAASDMFLGWTSSGDRDFYIRQMRDRSLSPSITNMREGDFIVYAELCGWSLARAHARSGDAAQISGYLGRSDAFETAITSFAEVYADQVERDYAALVAATKSGRVQVEKGV